MYKGLFLKINLFEHLFCPMSLPSGPSEYGAETGNRRRECWWPKNVGTHSLGNCSELGYLLCAIVCVCVKGGSQEGSVVVERVLLLYLKEKCKRWLCSIGGRDQAYLLHLTLMKTYFKQLHPCQMSYFGSKLLPSEWEVSQNQKVGSNYKLIGELEAKVGLSQNPS